MSLLRPGAAYVLILLAALYSLDVSRAADVPPWLSGKPDLAMVDARAKLYEWVFAQADAQTNGLASEEPLARKRLINLSNKLAVHFKTTTQKEYSAELTFLVADADGPIHFHFLVRREKLQRLLPE